MVILEFRKFTVKDLVGSWYGGRHFRARVGYAYYFPTKVLIYSWDLYTCYLILLKGPSVNPVTVTLAFKCQCGFSVLERNSQSISRSPWTHALAMCLLGHKRSQKGAFSAVFAFPLVWMPIVLTFGSAIPLRPWHIQSYISKENVCIAQNLAQISGLLWFSQSLRLLLWRLWFQDDNLTGFNGTAFIWWFRACKQCTLIVGIPD